MEFNSKMELRNCRVDPSSEMSGSRGCNLVMSSFNCLGLYFFVFSVLMNAGSKPTTVIGSRGRGLDLT